MLQYSPLNSEILTSGYLVGNAPQNTEQQLKGHSFS